ncbi:DUF1129 family protein [Nicoliella lavandulae]|uniref:DUF1129 family protein n=1 Tax=Nicoliella lavandulae TaxID=3082954 RepID=A0ABU8SJQ4_9LACO
MSNENRKRNAAAAAQQKRSAAKIEERNAFDDMGLTKRNAEYMFRFKQQLDQLNLTAEKKRETVDSMVKELVDNQKSGATARNLYGTVEERIESIKNPPRQKEPILANYWPNAVYNFFVFFALFMVLYGITFMISKPATGQENSAGLVAVLIASALTGAGMPIITRLFDVNVIHTHKWYTRALLMIGMFIVWIAVFYSTALIPTAINPILPAVVDIILAVLSFAASFWIKSKYTITTGLFMARNRVTKK